MVALQMLPKKAGQCPAFFCPIDGAVVDRRLPSLLRVDTKSVETYISLHGTRCPDPMGRAGRASLVEAHVTEGVQRASVDLDAGDHTHICRPVGLWPKETQQASGHTIERLEPHTACATCRSRRAYLLALAARSHSTLAGPSRRWAAATRRGPSAPPRSPSSFCPCATPFFR